MCSCGDYDVAECYRETSRKARKNHDCEECLRGIKAGDNYVYGSGIYDSRPYSVRYCLRCVRIREMHARAERTLNGETDCYPPTGMLHEMVRQCAHDDDRYFWHLLAARRKGLKPIRSGYEPPKRQRDILMEGT